MQAERKEHEKPPRPNSGTIGEREVKSSRKQRLARRACAHTNGTRPSACACSAKSFHLPNVPHSRVRRSAQRTSHWSEADHRHSRQSRRMVEANTKSARVVVVHISNEYTTCGSTGLVTPLRRQTERRSSHHRLCAEYMHRHTHTHTHTHTPSAGCWRSPTAAVSSPPRQTCRTSPLL